MERILTFIIFSLLCSAPAYVATEIMYAFLGSWAIKENKGEITKKEVRHNKILFAIALSMLFVAMLVFD
jgi:hypothetical protein